MSISIKIDDLTEESAYNYLAYKVTTDPDVLNVLFFKIGNPKDLDLISKSLYEITKVNGASMRMFQKLIEYEFQLSKTPDTIMRANSLGTKSTDHIIKDLTPQFIAKVLGDLVKRAVDPEFDLEVDKK